MADQVWYKYMILWTLYSMALEQVEGTFPIIVTGISAVFGVTVPYSFILPGFGRRRRSVEVGEASKETVGFTQLNALFNGMGLEEVECQKRLLCKVSQDPHKYSPLSEIIFQHLDPRVDHRLMWTSNQTSPTHLGFYELYEAGRKGFYPGTDCLLETIGCPCDPDQSIDWNQMKTYRLLKQLLNISFK